MKIDIITIFPDIVNANFADSIMQRAITKGLVEVQIHDLRKWTTDSRRTVDDRPFGGGPGMLILVEPLYKALKELGVYPNRTEGTKVVLTSARGVTWDQTMAQQYAQDLTHLVIICGRYEGVDHRIIENMIDVEVSIGNYVLSGGELAANVISDSIIRLIPGVLGNPGSLAEESHSFNEEQVGEYPQYTRPAEFVTEEGMIWKVPEILLSGHHAEIAKWQSQNLKRE